MDAPSKTVLIVDDEELVRHVQRRILEDAGFDVVEASDGVEALALLKSDIPLLLIISDVDMPNLTGDEMAREVARTRPGLKVLFVSGRLKKLFADDPVLQEGRAFLEKPFTKASLIEAVSLLQWGTLKPNFGPDLSAL
jgi:CheY-like chemotaxis protein